MSPKNLHTAMLRLSLIELPAPIIITNGNSISMHIALYHPLRQDMSPFVPPGIHGRHRVSAIMDEHHQKLPRNFISRPLRDISNPQRNGNASLTAPIYPCSALMLHPPITVLAAHSRPASSTKMSKFRHMSSVSTADTATSMVSTAFGRWRRNKAYSMLAIYSHISDQVGPLRGFVSPHPRISHGRNAGSIVMPSNIIRST